MKLRILAFVASLLGIELTFHIRRVAGNLKRRENRGTTLRSTTDAKDAAAAFTTITENPNANGTYYLSIESKVAEREVAGEDRKAHARAVSSGLPGPGEGGAADPGAAAGQHDDGAGAAAGGDVHAAAAPEDGAGGGEGVGADWIASTGLAVEESGGEAEAEEGAEQKAG